MGALPGTEGAVWLQCDTAGGNGKYFDELEDRWKYIGQEVFKDKPQGLSTNHPFGGSWVGDLYGSAEWYDIDGYQSSHGTGQRTINFINKTILIYFPGKQEVNLFLPPGRDYKFSWFNPVTGEYTEAVVENKKRILNIQNPLEKDAVLVAIAID